MNTKTRLQIEKITEKLQPLLLQLSDINTELWRSRKTNTTEEARLEVQQAMDSVQEAIDSLAEIE